jgi:hypothetical protein
VTRKSIAIIFERFADLSYCLTTWKSICFNFVTRFKKVKYVFAFNAAWDGDCVNFIPSIAGVHRVFKGFGLCQ